MAAFARVLADHGYAGATIAAIADEAGIAPGLIHHHFDDKQEILSTLLATLIGQFRQRVREYEDETDPLTAYVDAALRLDERADVVAARCWVGVFAEAIRDPALFRQVRSLIDGELSAIQRRAGAALGRHEASAVLAFIVGALVLGAFAPRKTAGFAAPALTAWLETVR